MSSPHHLLVLANLRAPIIGGQRKVFCRKTMPPFGSHQAPLHKVSWQPAKEYPQSNRRAGNSSPKCTIGAHNLKAEDQALPAHLPQISEVKMFSREAFLARYANNALPCPNSS